MTQQLAQVIGSMAEAVIPPPQYGRYGWEYPTVLLLLNDTWQQYLDGIIAETHAAMEEIGLPCRRIPSIEAMASMEQEEYTDEIHNSDQDRAQWSAIEFYRMAVQGRDRLRAAQSYRQDSWFGYGPVRAAENVVQNCNAALYWCKEANAAWAKTANVEAGWTEEV